MGEKLSQGERFQSKTKLTEPEVEKPVDLVVVAGAIKWFDVSKGFGFIVPDNDMPDVLLHVACLRQDGFHTAYEGARVVCEVVSRERGLQAFRVLSMDDSTAVHPSQLAPARTHVEVEATSDLFAALCRRSKSDT